MPNPRFERAQVVSDGLLVSWADVSPDEFGTLLLSLLVRRPDGSTLQFGAKWVRNAPDSPFVFVWDTRAVKQLNHPDATAALERTETGLAVVFPGSMVKAVLDGGERAVEAVVNLDGGDVSSVTVDLAVE